MFLDRILTEKRKEVEKLKNGKHHVKRHTFTPRSLSQALQTGRDGFGLIAEVKKASPSKGVIREDFDPVALAQHYEAAGVQAISVLTDQTFFQGDLKFLRMIREAVDVPLLRKDFIIDRVQIDESVSAGADAILLIAAALKPEELVDLCQYAHGHGLEVLLEVHTEAELTTALRAELDILGINNRDLHTFAVSLNVTRQLISQVPNHVPVISESGITSAEEMQELKCLGVTGVLVGEFLMRQEDVGAGIHYLRGER